MVKLGVIKKQFASDGMVGCSKLKQKLNNQTNRALEQLHREPMEQNLEILNCK